MGCCWWGWCKTALAFLPKTLCPCHRSVWWTDSPYLGYYLKTLPEIDIKNPTFFKKAMNFSLVIFRYPNLRMGTPKCLYIIFSRETYIQSSIPRKCLETVKTCVLEWVWSAFNSVHRKAITIVSLVTASEVFLKIKNIYFCMYFKCCIIFR